MHIYIVTPMGSTHTLLVNVDDTIEMVKAKIEGIPPDQQRILHFTPGRPSVVVEEGDTLADYDVAHESTLFLMLWRHVGTLVYVLLCCVQPIILCSLQIFVRMVSHPDTIIAMEVDAIDNIWTVKGKIHCMKGIPPNQQCLEFDGKQLKDSDTVAACGIRNDSTLSVSLLTMHIFLNFAERKTITLKVEPYDSIECMKAHIQKEDNIQLDQQCLMFAGKEITHGCTLAECGIWNNSTIHVVNCSMRILVKTPTGATIVLTVEAGDSVQGVKSKIQEQLGFSPEQQYLVYKGYLLHDRDAFYSCSVSAGSVIQLVLCKVIFVKTILGNSIAVPYHSGATIAGVKAVVECEVSIPAREQHLFSANIELQDSVAVEGYVGHCLYLMSDTPSLCSQDQELEVICMAQYQKAVHDNPAVSLHLAKCIVSGPPGVGKTWLKHVLLGQRPPEKCPSTPVYTKAHMIAVNDRILLSGSDWTVVTDESGVWSLLQSPQEAPSANTSASSYNDSSYPALHWFSISEV